MILSKMDIHFVVRLNHKNIPKYWDKFTKNSFSMDLAMAIAFWNNFQIYLISNGFQTMFSSFVCFEKNLTVVGGENWRRGVVSGD